MIDVVKTNVEHIRNIVPLQYLADRLNVYRVYFGLAKGNDILFVFEIFKFKGFLVFLKS